jgi:putative PIN family toxin of toxin-antitoxin system
LNRTRERVVVDTNVLVSQLVLPFSVPDEAVRKAVTSGRLLFSDSTMKELAGVLSRPKFDRYVSSENRVQFLSGLCSIGEFVPIIRVVHECRDPRDDKFLEVALNGKADLILIGDADLLALHPWREITIVSPTSFLKR